MTDYYANWLIKERNSKGTWFDLRDSLKAIEALGLYATKNQLSTPNIEILVRKKHNSSYIVELFKMNIAR